MKGMERTIQKILGRNVKLYRQRMGLSQEALADKAFLHRSYVGAVERGKRNICLINLVRLAEALDVEPCGLLVKDAFQCLHIKEWQTYCRPASGYGREISDSGRLPQ